RFEGPADPVVDLLGAMRLGEHFLADEPGRAPGVISSPVVRVVVRAPIRVVGRRLLEGWVHLDLGRGGIPVEDRDRRADEDGTENAIGMLGGEAERVA